MTLQKKKLENMSTKVSKAEKKSRLLSAGAYETL